MGKNNEQTAEEKLQAQLEEQTQLTEDGKTLNNALLQDPDIQAVIKAKNANEKVQVTVGEVKPESKADPKTQPKQLSEMTEEEVEGMSMKETMMAMQRESQAHTEAMVKSGLEQGLKPLQEQASNSQTFIDDQRREVLAEQVAKARGDFEDFDTYIPDMKELAKGNPGLSIEELYTVSRTRKVGPPSQALESERPDRTSAREVSGQKLLPDAPPTRRSFDLILDEALAD